MESDISVPTWTHLKTMDQKYVDHRATLFKHYIIISGGINHSINPNTPTKNIYIFDIEKNVGYMKRPTGDIFNPRTNHSACLYQGNKIILFGGQMLSDNPTQAGSYISDEVGILTLKEGKTLELEWKVVQCKSKHNLKRAHHIAHIYQNKMYVFAGTSDSDPTLAGDNHLWSLNLDTWEWSQEFPSGIEPKGRVGASSVIVNNRIFIFGGKTPESKLGDIWALNLGDMRWSELAVNNLYPSGCYASAQERDGFIYVFGDERSHPLGITTQIYNLKANTISLLKTEGIQPNERFKHSLICYKDMLILFGGTTTDQEIAIYTFVLKLPFTTNTNKRRLEAQNVLLKEMLESKVYSDIIFQVNGYEIKAHKSVLAVRCKYFANMFESEPNVTKIIIEDVKTHIFETLLQFIYCDEVLFYNDLAIDLLQVSHKYSFEELKSVCEEFLMNNITLENFVELIELTEQFEAKALRRTLIRFVSQNVDKIKLKENPSMLPSSILWEVFSFLA